MSKISWRLAVLLLVLCASVAVVLPETQPITVAPNGTVDVPLPIAIDPAWVGHLSVRIDDGIAIYRADVTDTTLPFTPRNAGEHLITVLDADTGATLYETTILVFPRTETAPEPAAEPPANETPPADASQALNETPPPVDATKKEVAPINTSVTIAPPETPPRRRPTQPLLAWDARQQWSRGAPDAQARSRLQAQLPNMTVDEARRDARGRYDLRLRAAGWNSLEMHGSQSLPQNDSIAFLGPEGTSTDIILAQNVSVDSATVRLATNTQVDAIARCDAFLDDMRCVHWTPTTIPFIDHGTYVEFDVPHFSGYAGVQNTSYFYAENVTASSTQKTNVTRVTLTFNDPSGSQWLIIAFSEYTLNATTFEGYHFLTRDGPTIAALNKRVTETGEVNTFFYITNHTGDGGTVSFRLNMSTSNNGANMTAQRTRIVAIRIDDASAYQFNGSYTGTLTSNVDSTFGDDAGDALNTTLNVTTAGLYLVYGGATYDADNTSGSARMRLVADGAAIKPVGFVEEEDSATTEWMLGSMARVVSLSTGTHTFAIQIASEQAAVADWQYATVGALRLTGAYNFWFENSSASVTTTNTAPPFNVINKSNDTYISHNYTIISSGIISASNTARRTDAPTYVNNVLRGNATIRPKDTTDAVAMGMVDIASGSATLTANMTIFTSNAASTASMNYSDLLFIEVGNYSDPLTAGNASINASSVVQKNAIVRVNVTFNNATSLSAVKLQIDSPLRAPFNTTPTQNGAEWYNSSILLNESGQWVFTFFANDTIGYSMIPVNATDLAGNAFINVSSGPNTTTPTVTLNPAPNGSTVNVTLNVTDDDGVDKVILTVAYPDGTFWQNITMSNTSSVFFATYTSPATPLGNYTVTVVANDTYGNFTRVGLNVTPYLNTTNPRSIAIDGVFSEWNSTFNLSDQNETSYVVQRNVWTNRLARASPSSRYGAGAVYDERANLTILFGGTNNSGFCDGNVNNYCNGTYAYNASNNTWYPLNAKSSPLGRAFMTLVFDRNLNMTILFGGYSGGGNCDGNGDANCNGTYAYNATNNTWYSLGAKSAPSARYGHMMVFDTVINKTILFGGQGSAGDCDGSGGSYCNGTYAYNASNNTWYPLNATNPPTARQLMGATFDQSLNKILIFGGSVASGTCDSASVSLYCNGTYAYNASNNTWISLGPPHPPLARENVPIVWDASIGRSVLFGGDTSALLGCNSNGYCNDTYLYNATDNDWYPMNITGPPSARVYGVLVFDKVLNQTLLFGGNNISNCDGSPLGDGYCNGTYLLNFTYMPNAESFDILNVSIANNDTHLFVRIKLDQAMAGNASSYYRAYINRNGSVATNTTTPEGTTLPIPYTHRLQVNGSACTVYNATGSNVSVCSFSNATSEIEIGVNFTRLNMSMNDVFNATFQTVSGSTVMDYAPDKDSFISYQLSTVQVAGPPRVNNVTSVSAVTLSAGQNASVLINFTAHDTTIGDLNDSGANVTFTNGTTRRFGSCSANDINSTSTIYNCSVPMTYYDQAGTWSINVSAIDLSANIAYNDTTTFTVNSLLAIAVTPSAFSFGSNAVATTSAAPSNPLVIDNRGNQNISWLNFTAYTLVNGSASIDVGNITINTTNNQGTRFTNATPLNLTNTSLPIDNATNETNRSVYFYITIPNATLPLNYSAIQSWTVITT